MKHNEFRKKLIKLVIPISIQQLMIALVGVTDALMLGFLNQDSLSAVSLAGQVQFVFSLFLFAITGGVSIFSAQYWGIRDQASVEKILGIGLKLSILVALPFTLSALLCPKLLMQAFASKAVLIDKGAEYLKVVALSYFLLSISQVYLCSMKNCGQAIKSSIISSISVVINMILNFFLIFGIGCFPKMGIAGAALATVISKAIELISVILVMLKKDSLKIRFNYMFHGENSFKKKYWKYTLPLVGNQLVWGLGFTMYTVIMGHIGSDATAANSIANIVKNLAICVCIGISSASGVMVGSELGKGNLNLAKEYGSRLCRVSIIAGILSGCLILGMIPLVPLFSNLTLQAQGYLKVMLVVSSYYVIGKAINMTTIAGIFPSGGDSRFGFKCDAITMWAITVPIGLITAFLLKLPVVLVYIVINIDEIIKLPAVYKHYKKYVWLNNLTSVRCGNGRYEAS